MQTAQYGDNTVLDCSQHSEEDLQPTFSEEEASLPELKNIPEDLVQGLKPEVPRGLHKPQWL